jgi:hypothetical protein
MNSAGSNNQKSEEFRHNSGKNPILPKLFEGCRKVRPIVVNATIISKVDGNSGTIETNPE